MWYTKNNRHHGHSVVCILLSIVTLNSGQDRSRIIFPGDTYTVREPTTVLVRCEEMHVFWQATNSCWPLLQQGPCQEGEWLVISQVSNTVICQTNPCPPNYAFWSSECVNRLNTSMCRPGMSLHHNIFGVAECDCQLGHIYWSDGNCYPVYEKGPCSFQQYLIIDPTSQTAQCEDNICQFHQMVPYNGQCYALNSPEPCDGGILRVNETTLTLGCSSEIVQHALIRMPTFPCPPGSRRDVLRKCRKALKRPETYYFFEL